MIGSVEAVKKYISTSALAEIVHYIMTDSVEAVKTYISTSVLADIVRNLWEMRLIRKVSALKNVCLKLVKNFLRLHQRVTNSQKKFARKDPLGQWYWRRTKYKLLLSGMLLFILGLIVGAIAAGSMGLSTVYSGFLFAFAFVLFAPLLVPIWVVVKWLSIHIMVSGAAAMIVASQILLFCVLLSLFAIGIYIFSESTKNLAAQLVFVMEVLSGNERVKKNAIQEIREKLIDPLFDSPYKHFILIAPAFLAVFSAVGLLFAYLAAKNMFVLSAFIPSFLHLSWLNPVVASGLLAFGGSVYLVAMMVSFSQATSIFGIYFAPFKTIQTTLGRYLSHWIQLLTLGIEKILNVVSIKINFLSQFNAIELDEQFYTAQRFSEYEDPQTWMIKEPSTWCPAIIATWCIIENSFSPLKDNANINELVADDITMRLE